MGVFVAPALVVRPARHTLQRMKTRLKPHLTTTELAIWGALALAGGSAAAWLDASASEVQGTVLIVMLVTFALTLPGRAPVVLAAAATTLGLVGASALFTGSVNAGMIIAFLPALIGAGGGRLAGRLLDTAASQLDDPPESEGPWAERPLSKRVLLAVALIAIAAAGLPLLIVNLRAAGHRTPEWLALIWQIMTLLGWIASAPLILDERSVLAPIVRRAGTGVRAFDLLSHLLIVACLCAVHVALLLLVSKVLFIPIEPRGHTLAFMALAVYLPLDLLAYLAILALGYVSDVERHRRESDQREAALRAESLDARLTALRARLNPHFLFNALNSVNVLARSGRPEETSRLVEGLTALLRYVLDERRTAVSLRDELDFVREYLAVQVVRFGARLRFEVTAAEGTSEALVPQLLLQPIVENAVEHGVARALDGGTVRIDATREGDALRLVVADDGPPTAAADAEPSFGIGLANTRERLSRLYGDRARLTMERVNGGGTRVEIVLPFETQPATPHSPV
ncbi:MAG: signal transduction histidine kinase, LytS [Gemmatimonadetes bacterium]|nr:signal transduction histidine kinase, LytS [Gemmatimonadota bacterium]